MNEYPTILCLAIIYIYINSDDKLFMNYILSWIVNPQWFDVLLV